MQRDTSTSRGRAGGAPETARQWTVVIPVKRLSIAKSRLGDLAGDLRPELAKAMALDCVAAVVSCPVVRRTIIVTDDPSAPEFEALGAEVFADEPDAGLNPALTHAVDRVRASDPDAPVAALSADLPALRAGELAEALRFAAGTRAVLSDLEGTGTTLLTADIGHRLDPRFGPGSLAAHAASGAVVISVEHVGHDGERIGAIESVRRDVDTEADLVAAIQLGVGARTERVARQLGLVPAATPVGEWSA